MSDLAPHLQRLGLEQYLDAFVGEGFESWETLLDIQETDFDALNVKLGHRRKLQRAIADYRGISYERLIGSPAQEAHLETIRTPEAGLLALGADRTSASAPEAKRKYRRHPKPDENAPERPPSAYVIFSNKVREEVKDQNLSFTQIAKLVGDRWQKLDPVEKDPFEAQANADKEKYNIQLSAYRKTDAYKDYMQYLAEFKAKHGQPTEQKRPRLEPESSGSIISIKSADIHPDLVSQSSSHRRAGSIGSVASSPNIGTIPAGHNVPSGVMPSRPPLPSSRSGSPPSTIQSRDSFRLGLLSTHSSVSDESPPVRSDQVDPLQRTAALTINSVAGTPPMQSQNLGHPQAESLSSPDLVGRSRLGYHAQQQQQQLPHLPHHHHTPSPGPGLPGGPLHGQASSFPPSMQDSSWRNRPQEGRTFHETYRPVQPSLYNPNPGPPHLGGSQLAPFAGPDRLSDLNNPSILRTLPPLRGTTAASPSLPHMGRGEQPRQYPPMEVLQRGYHVPQEGRSRLDASESDALHVGRSCVWTCAA
ncbi:hypothetical protein B0A52_08781 [Exophiala mesophila]|uniref:HMG box domain-containing protein n=1 Tax=Exophiala mesophila TaxID=212818 RepID=A0A438MWW3_EXOME|nr:hypothetical protein B0A52_08781 [Exophiala mesophila]